MSKRFDNRVALVTGAGSGMGRAACLEFSREGARVIAADLKETSAEQTAALIRSEGGIAQAVAVDVTSGRSVAQMVAAAVSSYGRLDVAFNNAGIHSIGVPLADVDEDTWNKVIDVNLKGVFLCMKYEIPAMLATGRGAIVNTSSIGGVVAAPGLSAYIAAKHGVVGLTRAAALDYIAQGIRINAVLPGATHTAMLDDWLKIPGQAERIRQQHPIGRWAEPQEIAKAVLFLCSDEASFVVGQPFIVDGGVTCV